VVDIISHADGRDSLDPERLFGLEPIRRIDGRNRTKADVLFYDLGDERVALKTYAKRGALIRNTLGRWLIRREAAAYTAGVGIEALPTFLGRLGPHALATRWVDAEPLRELTGERLDDALFDRLGKVLDAFPVKKLLFRRFCESDRVNLARMRARFTGGDIDAAVASVSPEAAAWHRRGRRFKNVLDRLRGKG
jgi:hypothetical protein